MAQNKGNAPRQRAPIVAKGMLHRKGVAKFTRNKFGFGKHEGKRG